MHISHDNNESRWNTHIIYERLLIYSLIQRASNVISFFFKRWRQFWAFLYSALKLDILRENVHQGVFYQTLKQMFLNKYLFHFIGWLVSIYKQQTWYLISSI